jgi:hypothetical protein
LPNEPHRVSDERGEERPVLPFLNLKFGLWALLAYLTLGLGLESLHGFKVGWYLELDTRRTLWTLAHAHGVLLSILNVGFGMMLHWVPDVGARWVRIAAACLMAAAILLPGGFLLGGIWVYGGDPGPGVLLSPAGGALLFVGVLLTAINYRPR